MSNYTIDGYDVSVPAVWKQVGQRVLHAYALNFADRAHLLYWAAYSYLSIIAWPSIRQLNHRTNEALCILWKCARAQPRDGFRLRNSRCTQCGWLTGNLWLDEPMCSQRENTYVCEWCVYQSNFQLSMYTYK